MIAVFDSGYGGLTVFQPILELMPEYDYIYLGDSARAPYGGHSKESITTFTEEAVQYLFDQGSVLILFACNTASTVALRPIQEKYLKGDEEKERKILGVTIPMAQKAIEASKSGSVAVVGTKATIQSKSYEYELQKLNKKARVFSKACPLLVPFIEEGWHKKPEAKSILRKYMKPLKSKNADTLILGCTHYPFMVKDFQRNITSKTTIIDSKVVAPSLKDYLSRHPEIESKLSKNGKRKYLTTGDADQFKEFVKNNFKIKLDKVEKVSLS
jgi:glutamate racemase